MARTIRNQKKFVRIPTRDGQTRSVPVLDAWIIDAIRRSKVQPEVQVPLFEIVPVWK